MITMVHQYYDNHCSPTDINHTICFNEDLKKMTLKLSKYLSIHSTLKKNEVVTDRIKKKKKKVVGRTENSSERRSFRSHTAHKGRPKAGMPQNSTPTFSHPKTTCKEQKKIEKNEEDKKIRRNSGEANPYEIDVKTSILRNKSNPRTFYTHQRYI